MKIKFQSKILIITLSVAIFCTGLVLLTNRQAGDRSNKAESPITGGIFSYSDSNVLDRYATVNIETDKYSNYTYEGITGIRRIFEANEFPNDPRFGFRDKKLTKKDIGLAKNQVYLYSRVSGLSLFEYAGSYDKLAMISAMQGICNRVVNGSVMQDSTFGGSGGLGSEIYDYFKNKRGIQYLSYKNWDELLPKIKKAFNGIIIFENSAEKNEEASIMLYNMANVAGCLPVSVDIYNSNPDAFEGMEIVAYFKDGISMNKALNYSTRTILPLTITTDAFSISAKIDSSMYSFGLQAKEASQGIDLAFGKKLFVFNNPMYESYPIYKYYERIMAHLDKTGVVWGWVTGSSEAEYSTWGIGLNEGANLANMSFFTTVGVANSSIFPFKNPSNGSIKYNPDKVYVSFSGESLDAGMFTFGQLTYYQYKNRGQIKMNWGWPASFGRMFPSLMEMTFSNATKNDYFYNWGDSYVHVESMNNMQMTRWQQTTVKNASKVMSLPAVEFSIGDQGFDKNALRAKNEPNIGLFYVTNADILYQSPRPMDDNEYGAKNLTRGYGYNWRLFSKDLCLNGETGPFARLDIHKAADYLLGLWSSRDEKNNIKNPLFSFFTVHSNDTIDDYIALNKLLNTDPKYKGKFEVVDYGQLGSIAKQIPKSQLDAILNKFIADRNVKLAQMQANGSITALPQPEESHNYAYDFVDGGANNLRTDKLETGVKFVLDTENQTSGTVTTKAISLPKGARYIVMDVSTQSNGAGSLLLWMNGNFGDNGSMAQVNLNGASNTASNIRSGRVVFPISEEIYTYLDKGYPVTITASANGRSVGASFILESLSFLKNRPEYLPVFRLNGSVGKRINDSFIKDGVSYFPAQEIFSRMGYKTTVSGTTLRATIAGKTTTITNLVSKNNKLYIGHNRFTSGLLPFDVWYDADKWELAINQ